ncbi:hypothetical protein PI125_g6284 [Phytophthora idaei]|nr:hypothetical protein PI125_g6284 [Phytophthora idaei]
MFVTGALCFSADGLVVWAKQNCPGSWNDGDTSLDFMRKLRSVQLNPDPRFVVVADSAFSGGDEMIGKIMTPSKNGYLACLVPSVRIVANALSSPITSFRYRLSGEWAP